MPTVTDWIMVGITLLYVGATFAIWCVNRKATKMTEKQLAESQMQFEVSKRLECMPFLQLELGNWGPASFESTFPVYNEAPSDESLEIIRFRNLGNGTAINLIFTWKCSAVNKTVYDCMPICAIQKEDSYCWQINFETDDSLPDTFAGIIDFQFNDLLGNTYEQKVILTFSFNQGEFLVEKCEVDNPVFLGIVKYRLADGDTKKA